MANTADTNQIKYNNPQYGAGGTQTNPSSVGKQIRLDVYEKQALIDIAKEQYFSQLSGTTDMPKNMGKTIKKFHWLPLLDDANITTNKNTVPNDPYGPNVTAGIRLGTPALTTRGFKEPEIVRVAEAISLVLDYPGVEEMKEKAKQIVEELCQKFPLYK